MSPYEAPRQAGLGVDRFARLKNALVSMLEKPSDGHKGALKRFLPPRWALIAAFYAILIAWVVPFLGSTFNAKALRDMAATLHEIGTPVIVRSAACVAAAYAVMCVMEVLALRDAHIGWLGLRSLIVPLLANSVSMGTGFGMVSGTGLRARLYSRWRLDPAKALFIASSVTVMSVSGGACLAAYGLIQSPDLIADSLGFPALFLQLVGTLIFSAFLVGLALAGDQPRIFTIAGRSFRAPRARGWAGRIFAGAIDWLCSAAALYLLLPAHLPIGFLSFATLFAAVHLGAMATGLPGGIGVFDAVMLRLTPPSVPIGAMAAALIAYRLVAFVAPSVLGMTGLALYEAHGLRGAARLRTDHAAARIAHWSAQAWARWAGAAAPSAAGSRVPVTVGQLFTSARSRRRISLRALVGRGPIVVLAPHPDDETLGCGGLLAACAAKGIPVHVVILTDGARSHFGSQQWSSGQLAARRAHELRVAAARLGLPWSNYALLGHADGALLFSARLRAQALGDVEKIIRRSGATRVFVSWPHDPHPDHIATAMIAARLKTRTPRLRLIHYPIWGRFLPPSLKVRDRRWQPVKLDVRGYRAAKRKAMLAYRTQTTALINDAAIAHRLTAKQMRDFLGPDEIFLL